MTDVFIKPATIEIEGHRVVALVRDPQTFIPLAEDGEWKTMSQYWARRLRDRDVERTDPPAAVAPVEASPAAPVEAVPAAPAFAVCANCVTPEACSNAARCVKAPLA